MAHLTCSFFSEVLRSGQTMSVVMPQASASPPVGTTRLHGADGKPAVLYLLHGMSDDHTAWHRYTSIERYAAAAGIAVVMPAAGRSFYADESTGHAYWTHISEELPDIVKSIFEVTDDPRGTYVAGLSMGGYGAFKLALTYPERYAAAASMSGALDVVALAEDPQRTSELKARIFGGPPGEADDLFALLGAASVSVLPALHLSCGLQDGHLSANRKFAAAVQARGIPLTTVYRPGGHEWEFWDPMVREVMDWIGGVREAS